MQNDNKERGIVPPSLTQEIIKKSTFPYINEVVQMDEEVTSALSLVADNFLYQTMDLLCQIVKHNHHLDTNAEFYDYNARSNNTLVPIEIRNVQLALQMLWNMRLPGYLLDSSDGIQTSRARLVRRLRGFERNHVVYQEHLQNLEAIRVQEEELLRNTENSSQEDDNLDNLYDDDEYSGQYSPKNSNLVKRKRFISDN